MRAARLAVMALLGLSLLAPSFAQRRPSRARSSEAIAQGRVFRVLCHYGDQSAAEAALAAAEATWPHATRAYGLDDAPPREPIRLHLYDTRQAFDEACIALEGRTWPTNAGLTSARYGIAVMLMGEGLAPGTLRALGPRERDLWLVSHESVHLIANGRAPGYAHHPAWFTEGQAEAIAERVIRERSRRRGLSPWVESRVATASEAYVGKGSKALRALLSDSAALDGYTRYILQGSLVGWIAGRLDLPRLLATGPADLELALTRALELEELSDLHPPFERHLARRAAAWGVGPGHLERASTGGLLQVALADRPAWAWQLGGDASQSARWSGAVTVDPVGSAGAPGLGFGRSFTQEEEGVAIERWYAVTLPPGEPPQLELLEQPLGAAGPLRREVLARGEVRCGELGSRARFELTWEGRALRCTLDGEFALAATLEQVPGAAQRRLGLGAAPGAVVHWDVR